MWYLWFYGLSPLDTLKKLAAVGYQQKTVMYTSYGFPPDHKKARLLKQTSTSREPSYGLVFSYTLKTKELV
jgi:hypothetical protein